MRKFFSKAFFFNWFWILRQNVLNYLPKASSRVIKTVFYVSSGPLWEWVSFFLKFFESFWILSDNCPDLWLKFSAASPNVPSTCPKYFFGFFVNGSHVFFLTSDSGKKILFLKKNFRHFCWKCILSVPRTFWGVFIKNLLVFQFSFVFQATFIELPAEIFQQSSKTHFEPKRFELRRKVSTESSKRHFTCPEEHFYKNNMLTLWTNFRLWARKCLICGGNFAALISNLLFCPQMGNWMKNFEGNFTFSDIFRTSREHYFGFFGVSFEAWWSKLNSSSQDEHIH